MAFLDFGLDDLSISHAWFELDNGNERESGDSPAGARQEVVLRCRRRKEPVSSLVALKGLAGMGQSVNYDFYQGLYIPACAMSNVSGV